MCDVSDPQIAESYRAISNIADKSSINWIVLGYEGRNKLKVIGTGTGGINEATALLQPNECYYGLFRVTFKAADDTERTKFALFAYAGPEASILKKGNMSVHKASVKSIFRDFALEIQTADINELTEDEVVERIKKVNY
ncbi:ADF-H domain-containing protein [Balamuthia mandrillaris]